jgi:hypothetical protein
MRAATDYWVQPLKTSTVRDKYDETTIEYSHRLLSETTHNAEIISSKQRWVNSQRLFSATTPKIIDCKTEKCNHIILLSATTAIGQPQVIMRPPHHVCIGSGEGSDYGCVAVSSTQNPAKPQNSMRRHIMEKEDLSTALSRRMQAEVKRKACCRPLTFWDLFVTHPNWITIAFLINFFSLKI